ncbi:sensor histidine kinase [Gracilibacillus dipsosauri]|uniref:Signal transduction histidine-protein kinase/phosphatase DegS n=1 Tax=Gracilibacillus dipsosauri TaxID=178340 RepID=A0A317L779_9BACI|nr:sensor histidine kinase [Gracilibacillus dipsosauri]PWU69639.1 histidine kinase [Gracilibacillus dipsosauri]
MENLEHDLDSIIEEMIETVKNSKDDVFDITEESRKEYEALTKELATLKKQVAKTIEEGNELERKSSLARKKLSEVSRNFATYSEDAIRNAYDVAHQIQSEFIMKRDKEKSLRHRRDEIELRLKTIEGTVARAENVMGKISIILNYLSEDFKHISDILQNAQEKQAFGLKIIEAQEEERRRLSREMHDGPAQMLANILLRSDIVERAYRKGDVENAMSELKSTRVMIRDSLHEVRRIIYDLRPMALDDLGLVPTIKKYIATLEDQHGEIYFTYRAPEERLAGQYEVALFRLIQESIQNALKHAEAPRIDVKLEIMKDQATVLIRDNGKGFDQSLKNEKSFGIIGMKERIEMLSGKLEIKSELGKGTQVLMRIPITKN